MAKGKTTRSSLSRSASSMSTMSVSNLRLLARRIPRPFIVAVVLCFVLLTQAGRGSNGSDANGYIVVIDAGSSGSRAHVFTYKNGAVVDPQHESFKAKPGLSSYAKNPKDAGTSMDPLLEFARKHVPEEYVSRTRIVLKATAGMRLLETDAERNAILSSVSTRLGASGFQFAPQDAQVIDGKEEGMLGWLAVNYLNANDSSAASDQWSVLEMGGASVQLTMPMATPEEEQLVPSEHKLKYRANKGSQSTHNQVFTHSFLGLGMESARAAVNKALKDAGAANDPCLPAAYVEEHDVNEFSGVPSLPAAGDFDACAKLVKSTLFSSSPKCEYPTGCFYNGIFAPPSIKTKKKVWAFENFYYTPSALGIHGVPGAVVVSDLIEAGKEVCKMNWKQVDVDYPKDTQPKDNNEKWCFGSAYMHILLTEGFGFAPDQQITMGNNVGDNGIDWALGAALQALLESGGGVGKLRGQS